MRTLFIFDSFVNSKKIAPSVFNTGDHIYLFSLTSKSSITATMIEKIKNRSGDMEVLQTANLVNLAADRIRSRYLRFIADLPNQVKSKGKDLKKLFAIDKYATLWWFSSVAEKSTYDSDAFNRLAQLDSIIDTIKQKKIETVIFGCDIGKLKITLLEYSLANSIKFKTSPTIKRRKLKKRLQESQKMFYFKHVLNLAYFALKFFVRTWKIKRHISTLRPLLFNDLALLVVTYYPNFNLPLAKKGIFKNKYYAYLQEELERDGREVVWLALFAENASISFEESLNYARLFIKNGHNIFFLEEFNSIATQINVFLAMLANGLKLLMLKRNIRKAHTFGEYNFYPIARDDWYSSFAGATGYRELMHYAMFKNLLSRLKIEKCLYYFEMRGWEKSLISARNAVGSTTSLYGYQHAAIPRMLLNYFNDPSEVIDNKPYAMPRPDRVICNGGLSYSYMEESGWPKEKLFIAEAIRYTHLKKFINRKWNRKKNIVLLAFSISPDESSIILNMVNDSLKDMKDVEIWAKPHPFLRVDNMLELAGVSKKEFSIKFKDEPLEELLSEAKIVVVGESSASIEALAFGCYIIVVNYPEWINMCPLRCTQADTVKIVNSAVELKETIVDICNQNRGIEMHDDKTSRIISDYFYLNQDSDTPHRFLDALSSSDLKEGLSK